MLPASRGAADHIDVLRAIETGIGETGFNVNVTSCDLSDASMRIHLQARSVTMIATDLLAGYRSFGSEPVTYRHDTTGGATYRVAQAQPSYPRTSYVRIGVRIAHSDTAAHDFEITPELVLADDGLTLPLSTHTFTHRWVHGTAGRPAVERNLAAIKALIRDTATQWLTAEYLDTTVRQLTEWAYVPITSADLAATTCVEIGLDEVEAESVRAHFATDDRGRSRFDLALTIATLARTTTDPERSWMLADTAVQALTGP
ncbi:hypothetical protein ACIGO9_30470 [Nocardia asteroides]|uniref:hypothetical protein n=1 Tax=Nocardia asteroides TaxID=1824 RepID=UPI0037C82FF1